MAKIRIRHLVTKPRADGAPRFYWQPTARLRALGFQTRRLPDDRAQAIEAAEALNADLDRFRSGAGNSATLGGQDGTVGRIRTLYLESPAFLDLAPKTQASYRQMLDLIDAWCGDSPAAALTPQLVRKFYDSRRAATPRQAAYAVQVLRLLWSWARTEGLVTGENPAARQRLRDTSQKGRPWSAAELDQICATATAMGFPSIALLIRVQSWLGQRQGDMLGLTRAAVREGVLVQSKTGAEVPLEWDPDLQRQIDRALDRNHNHVNLIICELTAEPWNAHTLRHEFAKIRTAAAAGNTAIGLAPMPSCTGLVLKDLRHTAVLQAAEAGCTDMEIASITGHSLKRVHDILDRYLVRSRQLARNAQAKRRATRDRANG